VQTPAAHLSPVVQALESLQLEVLLAKTQPVAELQESLVQELLSLQVRLLPDLQEPFLQTSPVVQALPSSQSAVFFE
jgi:hypothetical protein